MPKNRSEKQKYKPKKTSSGTGQPPCLACCQNQANCPASGQACAGLPSCPLKGRRVAVIGGLDRRERDYCQAVEKRGGKCFCHNGHIRSGAQGLRNIVAKSDLVIYITSINGHGALKVVKKQCKRCGTPFCPLQGAGVSALENLLRSIDA